MEFIEAIRSELPRCSVFLFGSRATGRHRPSSDFDIIVVMEGQFDDAEMAAELLRLRPSSMPVDLVVIRREDMGRGGCSSSLERFHPPVRWARTLRTSLSVT